MGSLGFDLSLSKALREIRMSSYSSSYTVTTTTTSSDSRNMRAASAGSDLDDLYFKSFCMTDGDRFRMGREFFSPGPPMSLTWRGHSSTTRLQAPMPVNMVTQSTSTSENCEVSPSIQISRALISTDDNNNLRENRKPDHS